MIKSRFIVVCGRIEAKFVDVARCEKHGDVSSSIHRYCCGLSKKGVIRCFGEFLLACTGHFLK